MDHELHAWHIRGMQRQSPIEFDKVLGPRNELTVHVDPLCAPPSPQGSTRQAGPEGG